MPSGSERWANWANESTAWAIADFLERFAGVRWYWPNEAGGRTITRSAKVGYPDNLVIMAALTTYPMPLNVQPENMQKALDRLRAWRAKASVPVTVWDYCVGWTYGPYQYPHVVRDFYRSIGCLSQGSRGDPKPTSALMKTKSLEQDHVLPTRHRAHAVGHAGSVVQRVDLSVGRQAVPPSGNTNKSFLARPARVGDVDRAPLCGLPRPS